MSYDLPENRHGEPEAQVVFRAESDVLDMVQTPERTYHLNPAINLLQGELYCAQLWPDQIRLWVCVLDSPMEQRRPS